MTATAPRPAALYGSLNARTLSYREIARTFVPPQEFEELCRPGNHVLLGPRGSGKTVLMKMLTREALKEWKPRAGPEFVEPRFIGVYVPADLLWARTLTQYWAAAPEASPSGLMRRHLVQHVITLNIVEAVLNTIEMLHSDVADKGAELRIVSDLAESWKLSVPAPSFYRLQQAIRRKISTASEWLERLTVEPAAEFMTTADTAGLFSDPIRLVGLGIDAACEHLGVSKDRRWALCFDELEISPGWLREYVVGALRSTDQRLLFKLSASPMQVLAAEELFPNASQQLHDYSILKLWHTGITEARAFCEKLTSRFLELNVGKGTEAAALLKHSSFATADEEHDAVYEPGSDFWRLVRELAERDRGLRILLREKQISLSSLGHISQKERDEVLRKLKPIVILRHAFLKEDPQKRGHLTRRTRKATSIYTGAEAIYAVCDGNPRWLTGLLTDIIARRRGSRVSRQAQAAVVAEAANRFLALLGVMPESTQMVRNKPLSLRAVLEAIGAHFQNDVLGVDVGLDPKGSFIVDAAAGDELVELIRMAATQGAVVYLDPKNIDLNSSPRGKRFRLSFLLAPKYKLPFRVYDHEPLSKCLGSTLRSQLASEVYEFEQAELFGRDAG